jgi:hypothetical protein
MRKRIIPFFMLGSFGFSLSIYGLLGAFGRMFTDDYCYSASYNSLGLLGTLNGYFFITTFTAHRYSLTFFEWVIDRFGIAGIQWMPFWGLLLWASGIYLLLRLMNNRWKEDLSRIETLALTLCLLFFTIYLAPNLYQSLYWRTGILPYTAPIICGLWLLIYLFHKQSSESWIKYGILGLGAFVAAGFSEAGAIFAAAPFGIIILWSLIAFVQKDKHLWHELGKPSVVVVLVVIIALIIQLLSPVNIKRQSAYQAPAAPMMAIIYAFRFARDFIWLSIKTQPLPNIIFSVLIGSFGFLINRSRDWGWKKTILSILSFSLAAYIFIAAVHLPSAYVEKSPPADRTLIITRFILLAAQLGIFYMAGQWLASFYSRTWLKVAAAAVILLGCLYTIRNGIKTIQYDLPRYQRVAQVWDEHDRQIKDSLSEGKMEIVVLPIDSQYIGGLMELYSQPNWVNLCAAEYYGINVIRAAESW